MAQTDCVEQFKKLTYPPLARTAGIAGEVKAHFEIASDGKATNLRLDGHTLLRQEVESTINKATLDAACTGPVDLIYRFAFDGEMGYESPTSVVFNPPNEYVVTTNHTVPFTIIDLGATIRRPFWLKRFLRHLV
jgi:Gram-negative bacterial TonB protein C-terminal